MKFFSRILGVVIFGIVLAGIVSSQAFRGSAAEKQVSLTGTISDSMCGAKHMMSGDDAGCVRTCVKNGSQFVLVANDQVYVLHGEQEDFDKLAGQTVTVTGGVDNSIVHVVSVKPVPAVSSAVSKSPNETESPTMVTIEGLVRDIACPIQNKEATATTFNLKCAQECVRLGSPLTILTQDGTVYTPISESIPDRDQRQRLMPFVGKYVRATGQSLSEPARAPSLLEQSRN
jgi:hypothetical protein